LWFGLFGGAFFWSAHLLLSYFVVAMACHAGDPFGLTFTLLRHGITVVAAAGTIAAGLVAYAKRQQVQPEMQAAKQDDLEPPGTDTGGDAGEALRAAGRTHHLAELAVVIDAFFLLAIIMSEAANFFVRPCR
jgi:hypothetical protein